MNKKGILGLDTVKTMIIILMFIGILIIVAFLVLNSLQTSVDKVDSRVSSFTNITTVSVVNGTGSDVTGITSTNYRNCIISITSAVNSSNGPISSGNWTSTTGNCLVNGSTAGAGVNTSKWNITGTFTYNGPYTTQIVENISYGTGKFTSQIPTFFILLSVVVLILIIAMVIVAVSRLNTQSESM